MKSTSEYINDLIEELTEPKNRLGDVLLKVKVLAYKLDNHRLQHWVEAELTGYGDDDVPQYRVAPALVLGNLIQDRGFGSALRRTNTILPIDGLGKKLEAASRTCDMKGSVFELDHMINTEGAIQYHMPHQVAKYIQHKVLANGWNLENCWKEIGRNSIESMIGAIRNHLLTFLLELAKSLGELEKLEIASKTKRIDAMLEKTIGSITGTNVNVSFGDNVVQTSTSGTHAPVNVITGNHNSMFVTEPLRAEITSVLAELQQQLNNCLTGFERQGELQEQINLLAQEISNEEPRVDLVSASLNTVHGILLGVAGNVVTPPVMQQLAALLSQF